MPNAALPTPTVSDFEQAVDQLTGRKRLHGETTSNLERLRQCLADNQRLTEACHTKIKAETQRLEELGKQRTALRRLLVQGLQAELEELQ